MHWLIIEDALRDRMGHWLEYVSTFVRGLRQLGDEVTVLCDRKAERFILEQTGARSVLPESIWHRMSDGAGAMRRYLRVPGHAVATFFAIRKFFEEFKHNRALGQVRKRATECWPEGRGSGIDRVKGHREHRGEIAKKQEINHENHEKARIDEAGQRLDKPSCAVFSNLSTSELARDSENTATICSADGPACLPVTSYPLLVTCSPPDWIFVPTVLMHHLLGWWMLLKTGSVPRKSRLLLFFPNLPIRLDETGRAFWNAGPTTKLMAWLFGQLRKEVESGRAVLGVETHAMRRALESLIGIKVVYLPHPVEFHAEAWRRRGKEILTTEDTESTEVEAGPCLDKASCASESGSLASGLADSPVSESLNRSASGPASSHATSYPLPATSASPIVFGCYGAARWEKGSDVFQEAIKLILKNDVAREKWRVASLEDEPQLVTRDPLLVTAAGRPLRFAIQWVEDFRDDEGNLVSIDPWLREHPQVEVIGRYFEGDEYDRRLAETDVMVLPYRSPYRLRVSRVVIEAMLLGMPVIATKGTTLFQQAEELGEVVGCEDGSEESLAEAILEVAASFGRLQEDARLKAKTAAESFSVRYFLGIAASLPILNKG
jgi:glycosyltransferase involved in cell wall biosynthesis